MTYDPSGTLLSSARPRGELDLNLTLPVEGKPSVNSGFPHHTLPTQIPSVTSGGSGIDSPHQQALRGRPLTQSGSDTICLEIVSDPTS